MRTCEACRSCRPELILLQTRQNGPSNKPGSAWHHACLNTLRHSKSSAKALKTSRDKFSLGSTARSPKGGCHETQPYLDPVAGGYVADVQRDRRLRSVLCEGRCTIRLQRWRGTTAGRNLRNQGRKPK